MNRETEKGTVWVTGGSSGLGYHTAKALRDAGWTVIAGARSFADTAPGERDGIYRLPLNVREAESCAAFREKALG